MSIEIILEQFHLAVGIPVSLYWEDTRENKACFGAFQIDIAFEIMEPGFSSIISTAYLVTPEYFFCGAIRTGTEIITMGPVLPCKCADKQAKNTLSALGLPASLSNELFRWLNAAPYYSLFRFKGMIKLLCMLLGEKEPAEAECIPYKPVDRPLSANSFARLDFIIPSSMSLYEERVMSCVEYGKADELEQALDELSGMNLDIPNLGYDAIRTLKTVFIVSVTLAGRSAKQGGLSAGVSQALSDVYLAKVETIEEFSGFVTLWRQMLIEFTQLTARSRQIDFSSTLVAKICRDIQSHIYDKTSAADIAERLHMSVPHLCRHFKKETGMTITQYIQRQKTNECKRLLEATQMPLSSIASLLGFSSQNYLHTVFKKHVGTTPAEYRSRKCW
ncbi:MAG: AraC family transcriptional regulator [Clostridiales bacterium]|jgi:AraC-like DNA-binding protein|nr:AraC family transcriptional regulator [Clostridiales bacterium]